MRKAFEFGGLFAAVVLIAFGAASLVMSVQGPVEEVTNTAETSRFAQLGLQPWAPGDKPHWIRIRTTVVTGRRISP